MKSFIYRIFSEKRYIFTHMGTLKLGIIAQKNRRLRPQERSVFENFTWQQHSSTPPCSGPRPSTSSASWRTSRQFKTSVSTAERGALAVVRTTWHICCSSPVSWLLVPTLVGVSTSTSPPKNFLKRLLTRSPNHISLKAGLPTLVPT